MINLFLYQKIFIKKLKISRTGKINHLIKYSNYQFKYYSLSLKLIELLNYSYFNILIRKNQKSSENYNNIFYYKKEPYKEDVIKSSLSKYSKNYNSKLNNDSNNIKNILYYN